MRDEGKKGQQFFKTCILQSGFETNQANSLPYQFEIEKLKHYACYYT